MPNPYDLIADEWHAGRTTFAARKYIDLILSELDPGAKILDLGCGTGAPVAQYLTGNGFRVVGVDQSAKMLEIARRVVPEAELIQSDMCELELSGEFAAVMAWDSIFHVDRRQHLPIFQNVFALLDPGGWFLLSSGGTGHEGFTSEMFGQTFFYSGYEPEVALGLLREAGFQIHLWEVDDPTSQGHIAIIARKLV